MTRRLRVAVLVGAVFGGGAVAGFGPIVRSLAVDRARSHGLQLSVRSAVPGFEGVRLRGVEVGLPGESGMRLWVDEVVVDWRTRRPVSVRGGKLVAVGEPEKLYRAVLDVRGPSGVGSGTEGAGGTSVSIRDLVIDWRRSSADGSDFLRAMVSSVARTAAGGWVFDADSVLGSFAGLEGAIDGGTLELSRGGPGLRVRRARTVAVRIDVTRANVRTPVGASPGAEAPRASGEGVSDFRGFSEGVRSALLRGAALADTYLAEDASVQLSGVSVRAALAGEPLESGSGALRVAREGGFLDAWFVPHADGVAVEHAMTLRLTVPIGSPEHLASSPIRAEARGGPVSLAQLGLKDGDFGLRDVTKARLSSDVRIELPARTGSVSVEGSGSVSALAFEHPKLASEVIDGVELAWRGRLTAALDGSVVEIADGEVDFGQLRVLSSGRVRRTDQGARGWPSLGDTTVDLAFEIPLTNCQAAYDSLPRALLPKLRGMRFAGSLAAKGHARLEGRRLEESFDVSWDGHLGCRIVEAPDSIRVANFRRPFPKLVYSPEGEEKTMTFGPGTSEWVPYSAISNFMTVGALVCEDGRFHRHHGFDQEAMIRSLRENLSAGVFKRGASTISMQLAKNLYLSREKVLARKLQEAVLTMYLEQELTKQEILELYFNVIEFGPMIYGIGPAARHWFNTSAANLSLAQSLYLASILQNPKKQFFGGGGAVSPARMSYLRRLIVNAKRLHLVTETEAAAGLTEELVYGQPNLDPSTASDAPPLSAETSPDPTDGSGESPQNGMSSSSPAPPKPPSNASPPPP